MTKKKFSRIYTDNTKYAEDKHNFFDALAFTVQKHLFTRKNAIYFLGGTFELWDFMTLTRYYIKASTSDFGQSEIESYISAMDEPYAQAFGGDAVEYTKDAKGIIVRATSANIMSMLWAAWIYARVASDIASDKNKRMWQRAAEQLYDSMEGFYDSSGQKCFGDNFGDNRLFSMSDEAMKTMVKYILAHDAKQAQHPQPEPAKEQQVSTGEDTSKLQAEIEKLKAELEELREQVEQFRNKEKGTALGLNQGQAALFGLAMANTFGFNFTNKKKELAPMLHKLFGWGEGKLQNCLSSPCTKEERNELANLFVKLCPELHNAIMNWGETPSGNPHE